MEMHPQYYEPVLKTKGDKVAGAIIWGGACLALFTLLLLFVWSCMKQDLQQQVKELILSII
jgi:hypothetical protein